VANVKSAQKRNRQRIKTRAGNISKKTAMRSTVKTARAKLAAEPAAAAADIKAAITALDKAAQKGLIKKATASRQVSRLSVALNRALATK
jgi:small subunit ribosomal protein S20